MDADVYKAPEAEIVTESTEGLEFYVVSPKKFLIMQISTMGIYSIYWFFKHWKQYKLKHDVMREERITDAGAFGILPEEEGVIHKLWNRSDEPAVSIHFYYPTLRFLDFNAISSNGIIKIVTELETQ